MKTQEKVDYLLGLRIEEVLDRYGVRRGKIKGRNIYYFCPWHMDTQSPNLSVHKTKNYCYCFRCNIGGGIISIMKRFEYGVNPPSLRGKEFHDFIDKMYRNYCGYISDRDTAYYKEKIAQREPLQVTQDDIERFSRSLSLSSLEYLNQRGIYAPLQYGLGERLWYNVPYITIPIYSGSKLVAVKTRRNEIISQKGLRYYNFPGSEIYHPHAFCSELDKVVFFVEDSFSAISIKELGFPSLSLSGGCTIQSEGYDEFKHLLKDKKVILIPDRGESGEVLPEIMTQLGIPPYITTLCPPDYKDFNDLLMFDRAVAYNFLWRLWDEAEIIP